MLRYVQIVTVALVAVWIGLIALGNITDYSANFEFVRHVLSMDTIFPDSRLTWRALTHPVMHHVAYGSIIAAEVVIATLCGWGAVVLFRCRADDAGFARGKSIAVAGYVLALVLWLGGFVIVGGEWFLMWQSEKWNGLEPAVRMTGIITLFTILLFMKEDASAVGHRARVTDDGLPTDARSAEKEHSVVAESVGHGSDAAPSSSSDGPRP